MKFKPYPKYKDSGIEWLGEIPDGWVCNRIKYYSRIINGFAFNSEDYVDDGIPIIRIGDVKERISMDSMKRVPYNYYDNYNYFKVMFNDILIAMTGATIGKSAVYNSEQPALLNQRVGIMRGIDLNQRYLSYYIESNIYKSYLTYLCYGGAQENIGKEDLGNIYISIPNMEIQNQIATFLDTKTALIDALIEKKQRQIELLKEKRSALITQAVTKGLDPNVKMKDSGIEWLGKIPVSWKTSTIKRYGSLYGRIGFRGYSTEDIVEQNEGAISLSPSNMNNGKLNIENSTYISWEKYFESPEIILVKNDILIVKTGSTYGRVAFVKNVNYPLTINPQLLIIKNILLNPKYLFHLLFSEPYQILFKLYNTGSTIPTMTQEVIANTSIVIPDKDKQNDIVGFLDTKTAQIDALIDKVETSIEKLKEYRSALITAAVTGKIDVRKWDN